MLRILPLLLASLVVACQTSQTNKSTAAKAAPASALLRESTARDVQVAKGMVVDVEALAAGKGVKVILETETGVLELRSADIHVQGVMQTALLQGGPVLVHYRVRKDGVKELVSAKLNSKDLYFRK
jgi:hypothetical protein